jgi:hypothetical protein
LFTEKDRKNAYRAVQKAEAGHLDVTVLTRLHSLANAEDLPSYQAQVLFGQLVAVAPVEAFSEEQVATYLQESEVEAMQVTEDSIIGAIAQARAMLATE